MNQMHQMNEVERKQVLEECLMASRMEAAEFTITGEVVDGWLPMLVMRGKILGNEAALLVDRICNNFNEVPGHMILDLRECEFFSSVAIGFIVTLAEQRRSNEGSLILLGAVAQIKKMIYMMGMGKTFIFCETMEEAVKNSQSGRWRRKADGVV